MKELSVEEKAKRYDEALERTRELYSQHWVEWSDKDIESIFPELKESEDEEIRKEIISFLQLPHPQFVGERKQEKWIAWLEKQGQKPVEWSEEDETKIKSIITFLKSPSLCAMNGNKGIIDENIKYLKSLKNRVYPKQEWSEEDEHNLNAVLGYINDEYLRRWLKDVIHKMCDKHTEWSEEDEKRLDRICKTLWKNRKGDTDEIYQQEQDINWLKSLKPQPKQQWSEEDKERYISCLQRLGTGNPDQPETINSKWFKEHVTSLPQWKPNKKQMHFLNWLANVKLGDSVVEQEVSKNLNELYNDLTKL